MSATAKWVIAVVAIGCVLGAVAWTLVLLVAPFDTDIAEAPRQQSVVEVPRAPVPPAPSTALPSEPLSDVIIPASAPLMLEIPIIGISGAITPYTMAMIQDRGGYDPRPWRSAIAWDTTIDGGVPGTDAINTSYLYGHAFDETTVFSRLKELEVGDYAAVTTANGKLCYVAEQTFMVAKGTYKTHPDVTAAVPNRLVLTTCNRPAELSLSEATTENVVVIFQLDQAATNSGTC